ncbi:hypothetical protein FDG2_6253 [Candidatus Protofrankia californiensis]|uniref:Antitoxin n=1 Tax=Candidatus Protofrankia californiensis TaxID=1839754 RepID=A0A1C3PGL8_9ACTN|nr:hypothetical protein FDG2_6253 [Candidatus Protofrankia californiensis]
MEQALTLYEQTLANALLPRLADEVESTGEPVVLVRDGHQDVMLVPAVDATAYRAWMSHRETVDLATGPDGRSPTPTASTPEASSPQADKADPRGRCHGHESHLPRYPVRRLVTQGMMSAILDCRGWLLSLVGVAGFEPTTSSSRTKRATKLRHTPRPS